MSIFSLLEPPGIFLTLPVLWIIVTGVLAQVSGWRALAARYRVDVLPQGYHFKMVSGGVGYRRFPVRYRGCLSMLINDDGIGFSIMWLFRFGAPAFFIPWTDIESITPGKALLTKGTALAVRDHWGIISVLGDPGHVINDWAEKNPHRIGSE